MKFLKRRKLVALLLVAAMTVACGGGYRGGVLSVEAATKAAEKQVKTTRAVQPKAEAKVASGSAVEMANIDVDETLVDETTDFWPAVSGKARPIADGDTMTLYIGAAASVSDQLAFIVEVREGTKCLTTDALNKSAFYFDGGGTTGDAIVATPGDGTLVKDHVYRVTIEREGGSYTINYYDATAGKENVTIVANNTNMTGEVTVNVGANIGTFVVGEQLVPFQAANVIADETLVDETTDFWPAVSGKARPIADGDTMTLYVGATASVSDQLAFIVEVREGTKCLTTDALNKSAFYFDGGGTTGDAIVATPGDGTLVKDHVYRVTIEREGGSYTINYYDVTAGKENVTIVANNTNMTGETTVNVGANIGTFVVGTELGASGNPIPVVKKMVLGAKQTAVSVFGDEVIPAGNVTWSSSDTNVATISAEGVITAKAAGDTTITITPAEGDSVECTLTVINSLASGAASPFMEVGTEGVYLTCRSTTNAGFSANWDSPRLLVNNGEGANYVVRADLWEERTASGTTNLGPSVDWASFVAELQQGVDCYISAVKAGDNVRVRMTVGPVSGEMYIPIVDGQPVKVALTNANCTMTNVKVVDQDNFNDPGPEIPVVPVYPGSVVTPKPVVTPGPAIDVPITPSDVKVDQTVTGTAWWTGSVRGDDYSIPSGDGSMVMYVSATGLNAEGYGAFSVEVQEGDKYFTTGSDHNAWIAEKATGSVPEQTIVDSHLIKDHVYRITVTRKGADITVNYYDATDQKDYYEVTVSGSNFSENAKVHVIAQIGTFDIGQQVDVSGDKPTTAPDVTAGPADPTTGPDVTAAPSAEPSKEPDASAAPSTEPSAEPSTEPSAEPDNNKGAETGSKVTVSGSTYKVNSGSQVTYTAKKKASKNVSVPATVKINGKTYKVTSIAANAFKGNNKIQKVTLSKNIAKIGKNAFSNCKKLKTIVIKSKKLKASGIAKNAFKGLTKKTVIKVPKAKKKAYQKLFRKKGLSKNVKVKAI